MTRDPCADGIPADLAHERLVHQDGPVRRPGVGGLQAAAGHDAGAERLVIAGTDGRHRESALVVALEASRLVRRPAAISSATQSGCVPSRRSRERHVGHTGLLTQPARERFVGAGAARADLPVVRHAALAGQRLVVHPEAEGEVTLRRKRRPIRLVVDGRGVDAHRGRHEQQRERHLGADDERPDAAELHRPAGARDPLQPPLDGRRPSP